MNKSILDYYVNSPTWGPEPTIRELIYFYYNTHFPTQVECACSDPDYGICEACTYAREYIRQIEEKIKEDNNAL